MTLGNRVSYSVIGAVIFASIPFVCMAQAVPPPMAHVLSVLGEGEVRAVPDQAQLSFGVMTQAQTAAAALAANSRAMNEVYATIRKTGVPEKSIQTSNFSVSPQYPPYQQDRPAEEARKIVGYVVSNQVSVILDDVSKVGSTLDALVASGSNQINGVSFNIRDPKPLMAEARTQAVKDAMARAQTLAKAAGVTLGPILSIQESGALMPQPMMMQAAFRTMAAPAPPPPLAVGEQSVTAHVSITWEIQ